MSAARSESERPDGAAAPASGWAPDGAREPPIYLVDQADELRRSLEPLLEARGRRVRTFGDGEAALAALHADFPRCVIADERTAGVPVIAFLQRLQAQEPGARTIVLIAHGDVHLAVDAMKTGAFDVLEKPVETAALLQAIEAALRPPLADPAQEAELRRRHDRLSKRERQVLEALVEGGTNKSIAAQLELSPRTVEIHRANVMAKMGAGSLSGLVRQTLMAGLAPERAEHRATDQNSASK